MSSRERRIVHLALRDEADLRTESEGGDEGARYILATTARRGKPAARIVPYYQAGVYGVKAAPTLWHAGRQRRESSTITDLVLYTFDCVVLPYVLCAMFPRGLLLPFIS